MLRSAAILVVSASMMGCGAGTRVPDDARARLASVLLDDTVALLTQDEDDAAPRVYCAAVWVGPVCLVTAAHCVRKLAPATTDGVTDLMRELFPGVFAYPSPVGYTTMYARLEDRRNDDARRYWTARVLRHSSVRDLAVLRADDPVPPHPFARLRFGPLQEGEPVEVVGHPGGYRWSYVEGYVSAYRPREPGAQDEPLDTLQIAAPISGGNSGGGAFDADGRLVGIASYIDPSAKGMGFFVHRDLVLDELEAAGCLR